MIRSFDFVMVVREKKRVENRRSNKLIDRHVDQCQLNEFLLKSRDFRDQFDRFDRREIVLDIE